MKKLIVVPTYNERENILILISRLLRLDSEIEILVVDDNSPDGTAGLVEGIISQNQRVHLMKRPQKGGIGPAYIAGFKWALARNYDFIVEMDADLSHRPRYLLEFFKKIPHFDIVIGSRWVKGGKIVNWSFPRIALSRLANIYCEWVLTVPIKDMTAGFKCYRRAVLESINLEDIHSDGYGFQIEMKYRALCRGFKLYEIPIHFTDRKAGASKISKRIVWEALLLVLKLKAWGPSQLSGKDVKYKYDSLSWGQGVLERQERNLSGRKLDHCLNDLEMHVDAESVLEVGCARGQFIRSIKRYRPDVIAFGCDINVPALDLNHQEDPSVFYTAGDALRLPFKDGCFDAVVIFDLLEHLEDPTLFLNEIHRVLKAGGIFHAYVPCEGQPGTLHWLFWKLRIGHDLKKKHRGHIQRFTLESCQSLVRDTNFMISKTRYSGYWLEQLLDLVFYFLLELKSLNPVLWKSHAKEDSNPVLSFLRNSAFGLGYYETSLLPRLPIALGLHLTAIKNEVSKLSPKTHGQRRHLQSHSLR